MWNNEILTKKESRPKGRLSGNKCWRRVLLTLGNISIVAGSVPDVDLARTSDGFFFVHHFAPLGNPSRQAAQRKHNVKHVHRNADGAVDDTPSKNPRSDTVALDEIFVRKGGFFQFFGNFQALVMYAEFVQDIVACLFDDLGPPGQSFCTHGVEAHQAERIVFALWLWPLICPRRRRPP